MNLIFSSEYYHDQKVAKDRSHLWLALGFALTGSLSNCASTPSFAQTPSLPPSSQTVILAPSPSPTVTPSPTPTPLPWKINTRQQSWIPLPSGATSEDSSETEDQTRTSEADIRLLEDARQIANLWVEQALSRLGTALSQWEDRFLPFVTQGQFSLQTVLSSVREVPYRVTLYPPQSESLDWSGCRKTTVAMTLNTAWKVRTPPAPAEAFNAVKGIFFCRYGLQERDVFHIAQTLVHEYAHAALFLLGETEAATNECAATYVETLVVYLNEFQPYENQYKCPWWNKDWKQLFAQKHEEPTAEPAEEKSNSSSLKDGIAPPQSIPPTPKSMPDLP